MFNPLPITYYSKKYRNDFFRGKTKEDTLSLYGLTQYKTALSRNNLLLKGTREEEEENNYNEDDQDYIKVSNEDEDEGYEEDEDSDEFEDEEGSEESDEEEDENEGKTMFIWRTAGDGKAREEHAERDGQEFEVDGDEWNELGEYNCRCEGEIISEDEDYKKEKIAEKEAQKTEWKRMGKERELETAKRNERDAKREESQAKRQNAEGKEKRLVPNTAVRKDSDVKVNPENTNKTMKEKMDIANDDIHKRIADNNKELAKGDAKIDGNCAKSVREGLNEAGIPVQPTKHAKDYGKKLTDQGAKPIATHEKGGKLNKDGFPEGYTPKKGDIIVVEGYKKHESGHIAMYDGKNWNSDRTHSGSKQWGSNDATDKSKTPQTPGYIIYSFLD